MPKRRAATAQTLTLEVTPHGNISMGFNCGATFIAKQNMEADETEWRLHFKNAAGNYGDYSKFVGIPQTKGVAIDAVKILMNYTTYAAPAYATKGVATFRVECDGYWYGQKLSTVISDDVILNFNAPPCIGLHSVSLSQNDFVGGKNDKEPVLTVTLDAPAPPNGQKVALDVSNHGLANIMGPGYFTVPAGQTSESLSWFLGTRKVLTNKSFDILVGVNASPAGHATVHLKKK
jgi:hypothetical protein